MSDLEFANESSRKGCCSRLCDPRQGLYRYIIALFLFLPYSCVFFIIELPTGLQTIMLNGMGINAKQYNLLFSVFTLPDIVLSVFGGVLVDKVIGIRSGLLLVAFVTFLGEAVFATGGFINSYVVTVLGRVILGCGLGLFKNTVFVFLALWFKGKDINLIASLALCAARVGTAIGIVLPELIHSHMDFVPSQNYRIGITFSLGVVASLVAICSSVIVVILDKRGAKITGRKPAHQKHKFSLRDLKDFSGIFWLCTLPLAIYYGVIYSFAANGQVFLISKFGFDTSKSNFANVLIFTGPIIIIPLVGLLLDYVGYNILWAVFGVFLAIGAQALYVIGDGLMDFMPFIAGITYSVAYSFFTNAMYPIPIFIVQEHQLTTAYSLYNVQYCIAFSLISLTSGFIIDYFGFLLLQIYFIVLLFVIFALVLTAIIVDFTRYRRLLLVPGKLSEILKKRRYRKFKLLKDNDISDDFLCIDYDGKLM